ncbi:MAG: polyribonucleotide nucleotidyltransferase [Clostridiales bacterium]|nr:polyribonucleotide nucleotidyltransferase [Clostridiales bacterium]
MNIKSYSMDLAGRVLTVEMGRIAEQAGGACTVKYGDTVVFVSATASTSIKAGLDYFPLSVEFQERLYSVGRIPGGFIKREGRPTDKAILTSRLIDRPIRPLFPHGMRNEVQVVAMPLSVDPDVPPDAFAMIGSSVALCISDIPFNGPTGSVVVGLVDGEFVINPNSAEREKSDLHLTVSGTEDAILMVEAGANEVPEDQMLEAIMLAHDYIKQICEFQKQIIAECGKEKRDFQLFVPGDDIDADVRAFGTELIREALTHMDRQERQAAQDAADAQIFEHFADLYPEDRQWEVGEVIYNITKEIVRKKILKEGVRPDGRDLTEIRPINVQVGLLPRTHGSGLFTRGQTQVMSVCTLGAKTDIQILDGLWEDDSKRYIHHYNFPPYSTGEAKPMRGTGRREIGHGALAERALEPIIPSEDDFPYTIRVVSEVMSSNGSTSQASVCGSTLALMDAGVPIKAPVAGIAMGLIKDKTSDDMAVLSDIQGMEDFLGDMDFKVAGTSKGITAIQMDIKIDGIDRRVFEKALDQAKMGRFFILGKMTEIIDKPNENVSKYAPKIITITIHPDKIREVIGPGGKVINGIIAETGAKIDIEDDGRVFIYAVNQESGDKALQMVKDIVAEVEVGKIYKGKVVRIMDGLGAFIEILPNKEGLCRMSQLAYEFVEKVEDVLNIGDEVEVLVTEIDAQNRINLSRKDVLPKPEGYVERPRRNNSERPSRNSSSGRERPRRENREFKGKKNND